MIGHPHKKDPDVDSKLDQLQVILSQIKGHPETMAFWARKAAEWVLREMFFAHTGQRAGSKLYGMGLANEVGRQTRIPDPTWGQIRTIFECIGNPASHTHETTGYTTPREVLPALIALENLLNWYSRTTFKETSEVGLTPFGYGVLDSSAGVVADSPPEPTRAISSAPPQARDAAWLQARETCWRFEASLQGKIEVNEATLDGEVVEPSASGTPGAAFAVSPDGHLAVSLEGCYAQLWELNPHTGAPSCWTRRQVLEDPESTARVLAVQQRGDYDAWVALEIGGELVLATGFGERRSLSTRLVPCGPRRPVRAGFSQTGLIFLTYGEGGCLLHELPLGKLVPTEKPTVGKSKVLDMDVANVNGSTVTALLVERDGREIIVDVEGKQRSCLRLEAMPSLLGVVRAPTQPLESLCVLVANAGEIKAHYPLRNSATAT